ncbi:MAG: GAF domain-containing sensor histidine kinase [Anaerolineae bacterium]|nr:GAF domain-containing sensor histidine kinase [Anaerolineae bacterium]MDQ7035442.1 GAF domain-containing sensor histidine kinase [Anaerolineae bacterium]
MGNALEHQNRELTILNRIAEALNREVDLQRALHVAMDNIVDLFNLNTGWIFLIESGKDDEFYTAATIALPPALAEHPRRMGGTCYCIDSYIDGDMDGAANINAITCTRLKNVKEGTKGLRYHASIPLYAQDKQLGILNVASPDWREISEDELRLLHTVGDLLSIAIERARLFRSSAEIGAINERNRLAREIHDTIAQGLAAIALKLETADVLLETGVETEKVQKIIRETLQLTRENLDEARRSVLDLRAASLEGRTLPDALQELLNSVKENTTLEVIGSSPPLAIRVASGLYRIAQEAINNIRQHAEATHINVSLILMPERIRLIIEDDGKGFDLANNQKVGHFGLIGLKERAKLLHGKIDIISCIGSGTVIEITLPQDINS